MNLKSAELKNYILKRISELNNLARQIENVTSLNGLNAKSDNAYITIVSMRSAFQEILGHLEKVDDSKKYRYK